MYSFVLPCLNEELSLLKTIKEIKKVITDYKLNAEIIVSDNGSTDKSVEIALKNGCKVCHCKQKGYGNALIWGTKNATGKWIFMLDADGSYSLENINLFFEKIDEGYDFVSGNRFKGGIQKDAMPLSHKIGVKLLSIFGNILFDTPIKDWHCGLRAFRKQDFINISWQSTGMEYASEMIIVAKLNHLKMCEVPTILRKDDENRVPHLRTIRDGLRHLSLILKLSFKNIINKISFKKVKQK